MKTRLFPAAFAVLAVIACTSDQQNSTPAISQGRSKAVSISIAAAGSDIATIEIETYTTELTATSTPTRSTDHLTGGDGGGTLLADGGGAFSGQVFVTASGTHYFYASAYSASGAIIGRGEATGVVPALNTTDTLSVSITILDWNTWQSNPATIFTVPGPVITGLTYPVSATIDSIRAIDATTLLPQPTATLPSFSVTAIDPLPESAGIETVPSFVHSCAKPDVDGNCTRLVPTLTYGWSVSAPASAPGACTNVALGTPAAATTTFYDTMVETCVITVSVTKITADNTDRDYGTSTSTSFSFAVLPPANTAATDVTGSFLAQPMISSVTLSPASDEGDCVLSRSGGSSCPTPYRAMGETFKITFVFDLGGQDPTSAAVALTSTCGTVGTVTRSGLTATAPWTAPTSAGACTVTPTVTLGAASDSFTGYLGFIASGAAPAPVLTSATASTTQAGAITLAWNSSTGATSYEIARSTMPGSGYAVVGTAVTSPFTDTSAVDGAQLYYIVRSVKDGQTSPNSNELSASNSIIPAAPANFTAAAVNGGRVDLTWTASAGASRYQIYRTATGGTERQIAAPTSTAFSDYGVLANTSYSYRIVAVSVIGNSGSSTTSATTPVPSAPPANLSAKAFSSTKMTVRWDPVPGATGYVLSRSATAGGAYTALMTTPITASGYLDSGLVANTPYYYVVKAVYPNGTGTAETANSAEAVGTTGPAAPTGLAASKTSAGFITVSWTASTNATYYNVLRSTRSGSGYSWVARVNAPSTTFTEAAALTTGTTYYYVVQAVNTNGASDYSAEVSQAQ